MPRKSPVADALGSPIQDLGPNALNPYPAKLFTVQGKAGQLRAEVRKRCPNQPGVYGMVDAHGELIYIGKAKSLRIRLLSYFRKKGRNRRAKRIVAQARMLLWEASPSEFAALHRELELIRRWRPRWNVVGQPLRRMFTHICLGKSPAPYIFLARRPPKNTIAAFGPIPRGKRSFAAVQKLNDFFQLRDCPQKQDVIFADEKVLFPVVHNAGCLRYEIGTCLAPCAAGSTKRAYDAKVRSAKRFLEGRDLCPLDQITKDMATAAAAQQFERAAALRDRLELFRWLSDRLERIRRSKEQDHFIYAVPGRDGQDLWYLIHGGRTIIAIQPPADAESAATAKKMIKAVYQQNHAQSLEAYEHIDGFVIVSTWFKRFPKERAKVMKPEEALAKCS